jgi:hypothetical protein
MIPKMDDMKTWWYLYGGFDDVLWVIGLPT